MNRLFEVVVEQPMGAVGMEAWVEYRSTELHALPRQHL